MKKIILIIIVILFTFVYANAQDRKVAYKILKGQNIQLSDSTHYEIQELKNYTRLVVYHQIFKRIYLFKDDCIYSITEIFYAGVKYDAAFEN